jgi:hypothetical protein
MTSVNAQKLGRVHAMACLIIEELHRDDLDASSRARLEHLTYDTLVEMGSALPGDLLDELGRLVRPGTGEVASVAELRIVWAQIRGWLQGIALAEEIADTRQAIEEVQALALPRPVPSPSPYL